MAKGNSYLSTGEAAKLLNISRSTVSRRFDLGLFQGKLNPITGERLISVESVGDFIKKHDLPIDPSKLGQKAVVLASTDGKLRAAVDEAIANDKRVALAVVALGTDTLIACSRTTPQLLVLDERLPDLPCSQVIGSLRKQEEQRLLRILCCLGATNQETARSWGADDYLSISDGFQGKSCGAGSTNSSGFRRRRLPIPPPPNTRDAGRACRQTSRPRSASTVSVPHMNAAGGAP